MSDSVDLVRSIHAAWERGDFRSAAWAHADIEYRTVGFDGRHGVGVDAMSELWREWVSAWEEYRVEVEEVRGLDDGRVLVLMRHGGRGKSSGIAIEDMKPGANVFDVRAGRVAALTLYLDRERALTDLGLER